MLKIKYPPDYDLTDNSGTVLLKAQSRQQQIRPNYETEMVGATGSIIVDIRAMFMEVRSVNVSQLVSELREERRKNRDLTSKLCELERAHSFMPSKPHLPKGYFDDLIDEDGLYD